MVIKAALVSSVTLAAASSMPGRPSAETLNGFTHASLIDGQAVQATGAWSEFCHRLPGECRIDPSQPVRATLSPVMKNAVVRINHAVNARIKPVTDLDHWGVSDRWDYPTDGKGDCEDIQIEKRRELAAAGIPARAMRVAMVINPKGRATRSCSCAPPTAISSSTTAWTWCCPGTARAMSG